MIGLATSGRQILITSYFFCKGLVDFELLLTDVNYAYEHNMCTHI